MVTTPMGMSVMGTRSRLEDPQAALASASGARRRLSGFGAA
jgi:hypothetical protein